jgi:hypothetical protein
MNLILKQFYENENGREAVKQFMIEQLREMAVERVFDKKAIAGIYETRKLIDKMFDKLAEQYGIVEEPIISNSR